MKANYAVPACELARDSRIVDVGLNFQGSLPTTSEWNSAWLRAGGSEVSAAVAPAAVQTPPAPVAQLQSVTPSDNSGGQPSGNVATFTPPLTVTVSLGQPALAGTGQAVGVEAPRAQAPIIYGGLEHRQGFQPTFLDLDTDEPVPLPELTALGNSVVAKLDNGTSELKYHHFSVVMHRGRRMALFTASNVDWRRDSRLVNGAKPTRKELTGLPDGIQEQWVTDWRIPKEHQLPDVFYTRDGGAFDKGHLVRRDDVCWGRTFKDIQKANGDTYHTTNCSPQVAGFNRAAAGQDNWGDLEDLVQKETRAEKAIVFSGPVLAEDDRHFHGHDEVATILVQIPRRFWKIVVVKETSGPQAYGFVLEQDLSNVPLEFAVPARWRTSMRPIPEIEELLYGLAQVPWLKKVDAFATDEQVRIARQLGEPH